MREHFPSKEAAILQCRSAFSLYLQKGIEEVKRWYPDSVKFVEQHKSKTLSEVTRILEKEITNLKE